LSTIEAVVGALNALEQPACFDALLAPFEALIEGRSGPWAWRRSA
jgi:DTW domain-containing protein YfiP